MAAKLCRRLLLTAFLLALCAGCADHLQQGIDAYKAKNYPVALKNFQPLAESGNAEAQLYLGLMYNNGEGVPVDFQQAFTWCSKAAEQGDTNAQYNLGVMYAEGVIVPQDWVQALKWLDLAALRGGNPRFIKTAKESEAKAMPEQARTAWNLAHEWEEKHR